MALQSQVLTTMAPALPGMPASVLETHYTALTAITASDVTVGNFVFADATNADQVNKAGTGMVRGLVIYTRQYVGTPDSTNSLKLPKGIPVQIATNGKFWVKATNANARVGDYVLASQTDGSVTTQTGNANKAGFSMTNFIVERVEGTTAGSLVLISNQQPNVVPPMAAAAG